jgi:hypothetical protein
MSPKISNIKELMVLISHENLKSCHYLHYEKQYAKLWKNPHFPLHVNADPCIITVNKKDPV